MCGSCQWFVSMSPGNLLSFWADVSWFLFLAEHFLNVYILFISLQNTTEINTALPSEILGAFLWVKYGWTYTSSTSERNIIIYIYQ